jgi:hypothetical protein
MLSTLALLVAFSGDAEARHGRHVAHHGRVVVAPRGHVRFTIGVGPWSPTYVPAPRVGFRWISGYYVRGVWSPGYWVPVAPPPTPGMVWVPGHWDGDEYIEGYWRDANRAGMVWVEGHYEEGNWIEGRWVDARDAEAYRNGPSGSTQNIDVPDEDFDSEDAGPAAVPFTVEEEDPSEPEEIHAPPPQR